MSWQSGGDLRVLARARALGCGLMVLVLQARSSSKHRPLGRTRSNGAMTTAPHQRHSTSEPFNHSAAHAALARYRNRLMALDGPRTTVHAPFPCLHCSTRQHLDDDPRRALTHSAGSTHTGRCASGTMRRSRPAFSSATASGEYLLRSDLVVSRRAPLAPARHVPRGRVVHGHRPARQHAHESAARQAHEDAAALVPWVRERQRCWTSGKSLDDQLSLRPHPGSDGLGRRQPAPLRGGSAERGRARGLP